MFYNNHKLNDFSYIKNWNVKKVTNMRMLFCNCYSLEEADMQNWETPNLTNRNISIF